MLEEIFEQIPVWLNLVASAMWTWMVPILFGVGALLTVRVGFLQFRRLGTMFRITFGKSARTGSGGEGDVTPFAALSTALAATVGNGNIAGVATALCWGGPGAIFWMWVCGFLGMATKYSEALLGVQYRRKHPDGTIAGGPMYYIRYGLNDGFVGRVLAGVFAACGAFSALLGTGNMVQSNSMATALRSEFGISPWITGTVITVLVALVILGGIKRIGAVAERLVPAMLVLYFAFGAVVLLKNIQFVPEALGLIFSHAFSPSAATGGFLGASLKNAIQFGARRGVLSNEAGMGSAPIAHAAAQTPGPVYQGFIGMTEVFIDTILVCTFTALILLSSGVWKGDLEGAAMNAGAFSDTIPYVGGGVVAAASFLFGYSTLLGWCYYGEQCVKYFFGVRVTRIYRIAFICLTFAGALVSIEVVFLIGDIFNAVMAFPNLIGLLLLSGLVARITREALRDDPGFSKGSS